MRFVIMDQIEELYSTVLNRKCFEEVYKSRVCDFLGDLNFQQSNNTDSLLLALTAIQKLYGSLETVQCQYLRMITDDLVVKNSLVDSLSKFLNHRNQHVVFSAAKAIGTVLQMLPEQMISVEWIKTLFNFNCRGKETEQPWRRLYTMEILRKVLKRPRVSLKRRDENSQQRETNQTCHCQHKPIAIYDRVLSNKLVELFLESLNLEHILFHYIPFVVRPNGIFSFLKSCRQIGTAEDFVVLQAGLKLGDAIHDQENVKREAISGSKENNLVAFLRCVMEIARFLQDIATPLEGTDAKSSDQEENGLYSSLGGQSTECTGNVMTRCHGVSPSVDKTHLEAKADATTMETRNTTISQLCTVLSTLIQYLHYPRIPSLIFKKILELLDQVLVMPSLSLFNQKSESTKFEKVERSSSISFLSVFECCLLDNVPKCTGFVGFCGTGIKRFSDFTSGENHECTDLVALRTASLILVKSSFVVLKSAANKEGVSLLQMLSLSCVSQWCSRIQSLAPDILADNKATKQSSNQSDFHSILVTLFIDQDDYLVEVLLFLLLLYQEIHRAIPCIEISSNVSQQLNPHLLFIAFVQSIEFDQSVLLDLLISSETRFLEYILQYLHLVVDDWKSFNQCLQTYEGKGSYSDSGEATGNDSSRENRLSELDSYSDFSFNSTVVANERQIFHNEFNPRESSFLSKQENLGAQQNSDVCETFSSRIVRESGCCNQLSALARPQAGSGLCHPSECDNVKKENRSGLKNIAVAYSSSDESDMEIEYKTKNACDYQENNAAVSVPEDLDKIMSMLIRLRLSVARLSSGGHFPYSAAPLITLMERAEDCYDGC